MSTDKEINCSNDSYHNNVIQLRGVKTTEVSETGTLLTVEFLVVFYLFRICIYFRGISLEK